MHLPELLDNLESGEAEAVRHLLPSRSRGGQASESGWRVVERVSPKGRQRAMRAEGLL